MVLKRQQCPGVGERVPLGDGRADGHALTGEVKADAGVHSRDDGAIVEGDEARGAPDAYAIVADSRVLEEGSATETDPRSTPSELRKLLTGTAKVAAP